FQCGVDRQENEGRVNVCEHHDDGEGAVQQKADRLVREVPILQEGVEHAVAAENCFPCVAAHQITHPERDDHKLIEEFFANSRVERQVVRQRVAQEQREECDRTGDAHGAQENLCVEGMDEQLLIVLQVPLMDKQAV